MPSDKSQRGLRGHFYFSILAALTIRVVLLPISMHADLIFIHYFPSFLSLRGVWDIYGYFGDHFLSKGFTYYPPLVYYVTGFFQWFLGALEPGFRPFMERTHSLMYGGGVETAQYFAPYSRSEILRLVFWMKLPYLLAEVGCLWLMGRLYASRKTEAWSLWLWNPVVIFSTYFFGQYRIFSAFCMFCVLYFLSLNKKRDAALCLGALCLLDNYAFFLLIPSVLILGDGWANRLRLFGWALLLPVLVLLPLAISSGGYVFQAYFSPIIAKIALQGIFRHYSEWTAPAGKIILGAAFSLIVVVLCRKRNGYTPAGRYRLFVYVNAALLFVVYAVSVTTVHYFMWILPFFVALKLDGPPWRKWFPVALFTTLFLFNLDTRALNLGLFLPLDAERFLSYPSFHEWISSYGVPWGSVVGACRFLFSALCAYAAVNIYYQRIRPLLV